MANFKPENVKRFVEDISKDVAKNAYEGGGSSYKGPVLMPLNAISTAALGLDDNAEYMLDYAKLADKLEALGIDVDSPWLREEESNLQISIGGAQVNSNNGELIHISANKEGAGFAVSILDDPTAPGSFTPAGYFIPNNQTIREVLNQINITHVYAYLVPNYVSISVSYRIISNEVAIIRPVINDVEYKTIGDVQSFMKDLLVPIGSGSGSGSSE